MPPTLRAIALLAAILAAPAPAPAQSFLQDALRIIQEKTEDCVRAYKHANYKGAMYWFCPSSKGLPKPDHAKWNDQISSVRVPDGKYATFCVGLGHRANGDPYGKKQCRTYFKSTPWIGRTLNDTFSFVRWGSFRDSSFTMAIMSDPQFHYCEASNCRNNGSGDDEERSRRANILHAMSIRQLASDTSDFAGVIVNGDITNTGRKSQWEDFEEWYVDLGFNIYPGLGNHDYDNYYPNWCAGDGNATAKYYCAKRILDWFEKQVKSVPYERFHLSKGSWTRRGSWSYSWDIGDWHFVQLNNYPSWRKKFDVYVSSRVGHETYDIQRSLDWLEEDLEATSNRKKVVVNLHAINAALFDASGGKSSNKDWYDRSERERSTNTVEHYERFLEILDAHPKVIAIFTGHLHSKVGEDGTVTTKAGKEIPVFFSGSAEENKYLKVEFRPSRMTVVPISSRRGTVGYIGGPRDASGRPTRLEWEINF